MDLKSLNIFLKTATLKTYAGGLEPESNPERDGFTELVYHEGDYEYRDSYAGFFRSWGQEVIKYKDTPIWNSLYGGGMEEKYFDDRDFALETFKFLKKAMKQKTNDDSFQLRGPKIFKKGGWEYVCDWIGDIHDFSGNEEISFNGEIVFTHNFFGGLIIK